jgi:hypothetical protein
MPARLLDPTPRAEYATLVDDLASGTEFAGYRIDAVAGRGGMGVVYRDVVVTKAKAVR